MYFVIAGRDLQSQLPEETLPHAILKLSTFILLLEPPGQAHSNMDGTYTIPQRIRDINISQGMVNLPSGQFLFLFGVSCVQYEGLIFMVWIFILI